MSSIYSRGITVHHFSLVAEHLAAGLTAAGVSSETVDQILAAIAPLSTEIATASVAWPASGHAAVNADNRAAGVTRRIGRQKHRGANDFRWIAEKFECEALHSPRRHPDVPRLADA